ncbi:enkurin-like isoform X1 [Anguilla rostrata]|uniref:enkurin-like isoform X1 n=2 Tax=Anguilla rostrata TaxID=7938 RepID=UPI0030D1C0B9
MEQAESVYNLIPKEEVKIEKPPRYVSKFREQVKQEKQMNKSSHKTMGLPKVEIPSPEKFLRKYSKASKLSDKITPFKEENLRRMPISTRSDCSWMRTQLRKDYIKSNAIDNILSPPRKPQPSYTLTKNGDKQLLENSGLVPKYVNKKDYGQIPEYLQQRKEKERRAQEEYDEYIKERLRQGAMKQLSDEERLSTLQGLKKNLEEMLHQYQCLSIVIDTIPKRNRKERLELQMKKLERDIDLIERHKTIYITNN